MLNYQRVTTCPLKCPYQISHSPWWPLSPCAAAHHAPHTCRRANTQVGCGCFWTKGMTKKWSLFMVNPQKMMLLPWKIWQVIFVNNDMWPKRKTFLWRVQCGSTGLWLVSIQGGLCRLTKLHQWLWSFPCQKLHQFGGIHLFGAHLIKNMKNVRISHEILACSVQTMDIPHFAHPSGIATESASLFTNPSSKNQPQKGACDWDVPP